MLLSCMPVTIKDVDTLRIQIVDIEALYCGYSTHKPRKRHGSCKDDKEERRTPLPPLHKLLVWSLGSWTPIKSLTRKRLRSSEEDPIYALWNKDCWLYVTGDARILLKSDADSLFNGNGTHNNYTSLANILQNTIDTIRHSLRSLAHVPKELSQIVLDFTFGTQVADLVSEPDFVLDNKFSSNKFLDSSSLSPEVFQAYCYSREKKKSSIGGESVDVLEEGINTPSLRTRKKIFDECNHSNNSEYGSDVGCVKFRFGHIDYVEGQKMFHLAMSCGWQPYIHRHDHPWLMELDTCTLDGKRHTIATTSTRKPSLLIVKKFFDRHGRSIDPFAIERARERSRYRKGKIENLIDEELFWRTEGKIDFTWCDYTTFDYEKDYVYHLITDNGFLQAGIGGVVLLSR